MRIGHLLLLAAGCGFHSAAGAPDAALPIPDGGIAETRSFGAPELGAGQLQDMTVDVPRSSLTPNAYTYGGLVVRGVAPTKLWSHGNTDWAALGTVNALGTGLWRGDSFSTADKLDAFGVSNTTAMTLWFEGEVWLDAGSGEVFGLAADDVAFIDLARPGTRTFTRVMENDPANPTAPVQTPDAGWYPIRIGFANGDATLGFSFTHSDAGGAQGPWTRERLRARASELSGTMRTVFGHRLLGGGLFGDPPVMHLETSGLLASTSFMPLPQGAGTDSNWSARYFGQLYIDQPGTYTLQIDSDDGNRGRLDTQQGVTSWEFNGRPGTTMVQATPSPGWTDVVVDYDQVGGKHMLQVRLTGPSGPQIEIPPERLRPVEPATDRLVSSSDDSSHQIKDATAAGPGTPGVAVFDVAGHAGETVGSIDVTFFVTSPHTDQLKAELETPGGARVQIRGHGNIDSMQGAQISIPPDAAAPLVGLLNGAVGGRWKLDVTDDVNNGGDSQLVSAKLTLHTTGGPDKIARTASWRSQPIDATTSVIAVDSITWNERIPDGGGGVIVQLGTCAQPDCSDVHWSGAVAKGAAFGVTPARYLQLRVDMASDGSREPELRSLVIAYRRNP